MNTNERVRLERITKHWKNRFAKEVAQTTNVANAVINFEFLGMPTDVIEKLCVGMLGATHSKLSGNLKAAEKMYERVYTEAFRGHASSWGYQYRPTLGYDYSSAEDLWKRAYHDTMRFDNTTVYAPDTASNNGQSHFFNMMACAALNQHKNPMFLVDDKTQRFLELMLVPEDINISELVLPFPAFTAVFPESNSTLTYITPDGTPGVVKAIRLFKANARLAVQQDEKDKRVILCSKALVRAGREEIVITTHTRFNGDGKRLGSGEEGGLPPEGDKIVDFTINMLLLVQARPETLKGATVSQHIQRKGKTWFIKKPGNLILEMSRMYTSRKGETPPSFNMPNHWRRGHWARQPYGPGSSLRKLIPRPPTEINPED